MIKVFDSLTDTSPTVFADLNANVHNFWDRGLLGMALAPNFPADPSVYVLYTYDHELGSTAPAPRWGTPGVYSDPCPTPPGATADGCVVSGRLSRLQASGNVMTGSEQVLIEDCASSTRAIRSVRWSSAVMAPCTRVGRRRQLQLRRLWPGRSPLNPCGDPLRRRGRDADATDRRRWCAAQPGPAHVRDPVGLDGTVIRIDPATGAAHRQRGDRRQRPERTAHHRLACAQPAPITNRPETDEIWLGDVGWNDWEEINRIPNPTAPRLNFGWPCYEGATGSPTGKPDTTART